MTALALTHWLQQQQDALDRIISKACRAFYADTLLERPAEEFGFELAACQRESWLLQEGKDLCYDRPNTPLVYALWYHGRRVNTFLSQFADTLFDAREMDNLEVFDLGAGTGAVQWAVGLVYHKMRKEGIPFPQIRLINVDTSPFMLYFNEHYLWKHFLEEYHHCLDFSERISYNVNTWSKYQHTALSSPWITASYLFDISDNSADGNYKTAVQNSFREIVRNYNPSRVLLLTALAKESILTEVANSFDPEVYLISELKHNPLLLRGDLSQTNLFKRQLCDEYSQWLRDYKAASLSNSTRWEDRSFTATIITKRQSGIFAYSDGPQKLVLHNLPGGLRREIRLNEEQKKAARNTTKPTVIIGPAGCGKSIVITERVLNIVKKSGYQPGLHILITTFNVQLLKQLSDWLEDILDMKRVLVIREGELTQIFFTGNDTNWPNIYILHFDALARNIGNVPYRGLVDHRSDATLLNKIIDDVKREYQIKVHELNSILNVEFLQKEYHRVLYGLLGNLEAPLSDYLSVSRKGRKTALDKYRRELVWNCLSRYTQHLIQYKKPNFMLRRQLFLNKLTNGELPSMFDYILVDEFQDFTKADFTIFFHLLHDPNHLVVAGDLAQSVQLGKSADIDQLRESMRAGRTLKDIRWMYLNGSYRLPFRICEAIQKISEHIHASFERNTAARVLAPYKGAPPGARPIVVAGHRDTDIAPKIQQILKLYGLFNLNSFCILEKDGYLAQALKIESDSVLRLKGLEKSCIIWSTRAFSGHPDESFEFAYTILTRTSCLLIIALFYDNRYKPGTAPVFKEAIGLLDPDRLIFWDEETKNKFNTFCKGIVE